MRGFRYIGVACVTLALSGGSLFAGPSPIPGTFHVVCGAAPKDGVLSTVIGAPVVFQADAAGGEDTFTWQFSDGSSDTGVQVSHAFPTGGRQTVSLTVITPGPHQTGSAQAIQVIGLGIEPNALVIPGAGFTGEWDTELVLANPTGSTLDVLIFTRRVSSEFGGCTIGECPPPQPVLLALAPKAQRTIRYSEMFPPGLTGMYVGTYSVDSIDPLPTARARAFATSNPSRAMELPIVTYEALLSRPSSPLVFAGALRSSSSHSNLFLSETSDFVDYGAVVLIEAIDSTGNTVGSIHRSLSFGGYTVVFDVIGSMNISDFDGQVRVTQIGGSGIIDGALATLTSDGGFAVSAGFNP
jgi:hypothetical protein